MVTVIVADFRGLDTLVEITVLLAAVVGVVALCVEAGCGDRGERASRSERERAPSVVVRVVARMLLGPAVVVAAGLIAKGYAEVGDGFGAGVAVSLAIALTYIALGGAGAEAALPMLRHGPKRGGRRAPARAGQRLLPPAARGAAAVAPPCTRASTWSRSARWSCLHRCSSTSACSCWSSGY